MTSAISAPDLALSSLIFTLSNDPAAAADAVSALQRFPGLALGQLQGSWIPGVLESESPAASYRALEQIAGIELVEVVYVEIPAPGSDPLVPAASLPL